MVSHKESRSHSVFKIQGAVYAKGHQSYYQGVAVNVNPENKFVRNVSVSSSHLQYCRSNVSGFRPCSINLHYHLAVPTW